MIKKGIISSVNSTDKKARVLLPENNFVTSELPYAIEVIPNDVVLVAFLNKHYTDGVIIQNLSRNFPNGPESSSYTHNQIAPSNTWIITHNLGRYPSVTIVDSTGNVVIGEIQYIDENEVRVIFTSEFSGKAFLN